MLPLNSATGYFTTRNFSFYGKTPPLSILGMQCIGSLWLKVTFRGRQTFSIGDRPQGNRAHSHQSPFPKGTCWTFRAGRLCGGGCKFDFKCYKCGAKHPATRCNVDGQKRASAQSPSQTSPQSSTANKARQSRSTWETLTWLPFPFKRLLNAWFQLGFSSTLPRGEPSF